MLPTSINNRQSGSQPSHSEESSQEMLSIVVSPVAELMEEADFLIYQDPRSDDADPVVANPPAEEAVSDPGYGRRALVGMDRYRFNISEDENREIKAAILLLDFLAMTRNNIDDQNQLIEPMYQYSMAFLRSLRRGLIFIDTLHEPGAITYISTLVIQEPAVPEGTQGARDGSSARIIAEVSHLYHNSEQENMDVPIAIVLLDSIIAIQNQRIIDDDSINRESVWSVDERDVVHVERRQMPPDGVPMIATDDEELEVTRPTTGFRKKEKESILVVKINGGPVEFEGQRTCYICMENFVVKDRACQLNCRHRYHQTCLWPWLDRSRKCPYCRHPITI